MIRLPQLVTLFFLTTVLSSLSVHEVCARGNELSAFNAADSTGLDSAWMSWTDRLFEIEMATVTGETEGTKEKDALRPIRTIASEEITKLGAHSLRDLMRSQLNFEVSQDPILGAALKMNGLGGRSVNVLIDGVPLTGRLNDNIDLSQIALNNVERIEIIDGPMAVEFGTNSMAGTINIITKTDLGARIIVDASAQYESVGVQSQSLSWAKNDNGRHHSLHLNRYYFDGWSPTDGTWDGFADYQADSSRTRLWNPKLQHTLEWKTQFQFGQWLIKPRFSGIFEEIENKGAPRQPYEETAFDDRYNTRRILPAVEIKHYGQDGKVWKVLASYQSFWRSREAFSTNLSNLETAPLDANSQDTTSMHTFQNRGSGDLLKDESWKLSMGWDLNHQTFSSKRTESNAQSMTDAALFAQTQWSNDQTRLQLGLRKAYNSMFDSPLLPSIHGVRKHGNQRIRVSYARGFRAPSLKEMYFRFVDINHTLFGNLNLTPETSDFAQVSWAVQQERIALSAQLFSNFVQNQIGLVDQLDGTYRYQNFAQFQAQGMKFNGELNGEKWALDGAVSFISSEQKIAMSQDAFARINSTECAISLDWKALEQINFGTSFRWIGPTQRAVSETYEEVNQQSTEAYSWLDAHVQWSAPSGRWQFTATAKNLGDVTSIASASTGSIHAPSSALMSWGRSFNFRLNYRIESRNDE